MHFKKTDPILAIPALYICFQGFQTRNVVTLIPQASFYADKQKIVLEHIEHTDRSNSLTDIVYAHIKWNFFLIQ